MHTATLIYSLRIDVDKLIRIINADKRKIVRRKISNLIYCKSSRSGFSRRRYKECDTKYPILIAENGLVIDGRHRTMKLKDSGKQFANCIIITQQDIRKCEIC